MKDLMQFILFCKAIYLYSCPCLYFFLLMYAMHKLGTDYTRCDLAAAILIITGTWYLSARLQPTFAYREKPVFPNSYWCKNCQAYVNW